MAFRQPVYKGAETNPLDYSFYVDLDSSNRVRLPL
jgi:hypothetical protein